MKGAQVKEKENFTVATKLIAEATAVMSICEKEKVSSSCSKLSLNSIKIWHQQT